jgi:conjugative relaxase-like TrwC/TraI family protein
VVVGLGSATETIGGAAGLGFENFRRCLAVLTISRLSRWSIRYYNDTADAARAAAMDRTAAGGGLGEYYSEADTRTPTWLLVGDAATMAELTGLDVAAVAGGVVDTGVAAAWLDDGVAPNGVCGRAFSKGSVHGFDLTFAAPKSVSLVRALTDPVAEKVLAAAHEHAIAAAMGYLHQHAGYTRVHNPVTGMKDLQRLPGLVGIAYQHETSRCGDPHLHTHVIVPNRQARADGVLVSVDSKSLYHEAKAAGMIYQATLRQEMHVERGFEWQPVDPCSGMAEIAGVTKESITAWSRRSTRLREWAAQNLIVIDGEPTAAQLAAAQKATRPSKPEALAWEELKGQWRADGRGLRLDRDPHHEARAERTRSAHDVRAAQDWARVRAQAARIDKAAFTRADMVELIAAHLPVDATGEPRLLIDELVDSVGVRITAPRGAHEREGHEKFTLNAILKEEEQILDLSTSARTGRGWMCAPPTSRRSRSIRRARSPPSAPRRGWWRRCARPRVRARRTRCARCAPLLRAPARKSWCWRRPARPSTKLCTTTPGTAATPSPKHCT